MLVRTAAASRGAQPFQAGPERVGAGGQQPEVELVGVEGGPWATLVPAAAVNEAGGDAAARAGAATGDRDVELSAWSKGRYGSAIGRAVHGVLQVVLRTGDGLKAAVVAQCRARGLWTSHPS